MAWRIVVNGAIENDAMEILSKATTDTSWGIQRQFMRVA